MFDIRYRGRLSSGKWVYGYYVYDSKLGKHLIHDGNGNAYSIDKTTLSISFGMEDMYGISIYEGDILSFIYDGFEVESTLSFSIYDGFTVSFDAYGGKRVRKLSDILTEGRELRIIGNKYTK